ncbi:hypothetical protein FRB91_010135 [Serendipita sp. 411]|nr:hypothetical protein FRC15_005332 [Serendipita sp. 397]KAG8824144.1 hypothetical protein FRC19_002432 [Serendipita sp. 401]KAG8849237.1 hypothetical protein FRB91_010135 [Serendipita sp. 411]KAG8866267.1 hypothetical protein FRC20_008885 [Serendipita sp. 405]KAG9055488.1 hypothetical protein FS842_002069 [Serendipita sp. 407]
MSRPSPSGSPAPQGNGSTSPAPGSKARQSMGPSVRPAGLAPLSPRPQGSAVRPTSELLGNSTSFQTPESEAIDQWFENLQNYEATLEEMAAASLDVNFKEELSAIEQWFRVLSEAERTAALYSLLQHSTQVQIRFFITVLQQMARSDPMTALLSPGMGGSMQAQMEAKLLSMGLKSPGLKAPASPSARNFSGNTPSSNFLTPDAALASPAPDAAATLAQQRARLKASNVDAASRRISAPPTTLSNSDGRNVWQPPQLGQVAERAPSPVAEQSPPSPGPTNTTSAIRPKSTDFTGVANQHKSHTTTVTDSDGPGQDVLSPMGGGNWASMVNTPLVPMFSENKPNLDSAAGKLSTWSKNNGSNGRIALADARAFRRTSRGSAQSPDTSTGAFDDNNLTVPTSSSTRGQTTKSPGGPNPMMNQMWPGMQARSPALSNASSNRFATQEEQLAAAAAAAAAAGMPFGMGMAGSPNMQLAMSPLMGGMGGFNMMNLGMGMDPLQAQFIAAQIASGQFGAQFAGLQNAQMMMGRGARPNQRGGKPPSSNGREGKEKSEEDFDPALLTDIPAWLRSLRLHKYTPNFEGMTWKDMVIMDEAALEAKGVAALGARRKMLKTFEVVRSKMGITMPGEEA